jgi:hypothetical protein
MSRPDLWAFGWREVATVRAKQISFIDFIAYALSVYQVAYICFAHAILLPNDLEQDSMVFASGTRKATQD